MSDLIGKIDKEYRLVIALAAVCLVVIVGTIYVYMSKDRTAPVLSFDVNERTYDADTTDEDLLLGVKAYDEHDGDLTSKVVIEKIMVNESRAVATVVYCVSDSHGNVAKESRDFSCDLESLNYDEEAAKAEAEAAAQAEAEAAAAAEAEAQAQAEAEAAAQAQAEEEARLAEEEAARQAEEEEAARKAEEEAAAKKAEEEAAAKKAEAEATKKEDTSSKTDSKTASGNTKPVLKLSSNQVNTGKGLNPAWVTVIASLTDDKDDYATLLKTIKIDGNFDRNTPGSYPVTVHVTDSQGLSSDPVSITITVLPQ